MTLMVLTAIMALAYANGANDNFKGVATLFGSGTTSYRRALLWAAVTTLAGALFSVFAAERMVKAFSGGGLVAPDIAVQPAFLAAAAAGAAGAVLIATATGLPVSTTHALMGALIGAGFVRAHGRIDFGVLGMKFVLPLLLSPVLAGVLAAQIYAGFRALSRWMGITAQSCVCVGTEVVARYGASSGGVGQATALRRSLITVAVQASCAQRYEGTVMGLGAQQTLQAAHWLSSGAMSFARGLNDAPKIVGLLVAAHFLGMRPGLVVIALVMAAGGMLGARRVAQTMATKITPMNQGQGFTASLTTAALVVAASVAGLPVSTTHVSLGSIFGIAAVGRQANLKTIRTIVLAWVTTLPVAAAFGSVVGLVLP